MAAARLPTGLELLRERPEEHKEDKNKLGCSAAGGRPRSCLVSSLCRPSHTPPPPACSVFGGIEYRLALMQKDAGDMERQ